MEVGERGEDVGGGIFHIITQTIKVGSKDNIGCRARRRFRRVDFGNDTFGALSAELEDDNRGKDSKSGERSSDTTTLFELSDFVYMFCGLDVSLGLCSSDD